jgi:GxxExxY protein
MDVNENYKINGAVFEVNRVLGSGFLEKVYENALLIELRRRGLRVESQVPIQIQYIKVSLSVIMSPLSLWKTK